VVAPCNIFFPAGDVTFLVGRSGSGKSTLGNLLVRFYEPSNGKITLDGIPLERLDLAWLRSNVTLIQQSSVLFNDSLGNNVSLGARDLTSVHTDDVIEACGVALLQSTIAAMPEGLNTQVGPGGYSLSGGQKQRVALARARLRDSPVLILDEVTSGLDPANRALIMDALRLWRRGKTTIVITHEVAQIEDTEYVYVMDNGQLVQEGYRKSLVESESGLFASLLAAADQEAGAGAKGESSEPDSDTESDSDDDDHIIDGKIPGPKPVHVYDSRFSRMFRGLYDNEGQPFYNGRMSLAVGTAMATERRRKELWDEPMEEEPGLDYEGPLSPIPVNPQPRKEVSPSAVPDPEHEQSERSSTEIVRLSGLAVRNSRLTMSSIPQEEPSSRLPDAATRIQSHDSFTTSIKENLLKKKAEEDREDKTPKTPPLSAILRTVWPTLNKKSRAQLILGLILCLVTAGCQPAFSILFAQLTAAFWAKGSPQAEARIWSIYLAIVAVVEALSTFLAYLLWSASAKCG
jgi:ATP-binding cassette subfamily B (MDR/TAP) protein 1